VVSSMERKQTYGHLVFYSTRSGRGGKHFLKNFKYTEKSHLFLLQFYSTFQWSEGVSLGKSIAAMLSEPLSDDVTQVLALFLQVDVSIRFLFSAFMLTVYLFAFIEKPISRREASTPLAFSWMLEALMNNPSR
jgi:hypothetical protein